MLPGLLAQIPRDQEVATVTADDAYEKRACHTPFTDHGAAAIIPPGRSARPWNPGTAGARAGNEFLPTSKQLGLALWRSWCGYHRRSRVEAKMNCVKLLWQRLRSATSAARLPKFRSVRQP